LLVMYAVVKSAPGRPDPPLPPSRSVDAGPGNGGAAVNQCVYPTVKMPVGRTRVLLRNLDDGLLRAARLVLTALAACRQGGALADWERLFATCPGAVGAAAPRTGTWGHVDVEEAKQFNAMQYLSDRGVRYRTLTDSPFPRCVRLTFKGGLRAGHSS